MLKSRADKGAGFLTPVKINLSLFCSLCCHFFCQLFLIFKLAVQGVGRLASEAKGLSLMLSYIGSGNTISEPVAVFRSPGMYVKSLPGILVW